MPVLSGKAGEVTVGGTTVAGIKSWQLDYTSEVLDSTDFGDAGVRTFAAGCSSWAGSFEGYKKGAPLTIGSEVALVLKESQTATQKWTGQAIVSGIHPANSIDGLTAYSYDFQGTGALTVPTA
ncbi:hypothetical protein ASJ33_05640 [Dehalococcoides mccartyi]|jgi:hypothetical protein|uniref:hypothetical protein n=1 Tax=Dehalococcoides mccartyi TaxID=61435 RepID=UPI0004E05AD5|nr:hypothetical protein [Dehalococcoides mccartyi]AII58741.1 hypothetical protein X792_05085 [Dehalococcoides mccartyi CG1]APH12671.1 hypothetical protein ASJ33_05640 [Dehalococcoides mccartyi]